MDDRKYVVYDHLVQHPIAVESLAYRETDGSYEFPPHTHNGYQWYCCLHGDITQTIGGTPYPLGPETSILIPPGAVRRPKCSGRSPAYVSAIFTTTVLHLDRGTLVPLRTPEPLVADLHALVEELRGPADADSAILQTTLLIRLLVGLCRAAAARHQSIGSASLNFATHKGTVAAAEAYMRANSYRRISRDEIATSVNYSAPHLARLFAAVRGKTPGRRLTEIRMEAAQSLLLNSTLSITQIAAESGLSSFSHFSKVFKEVTGATPGEYRRDGGSRHTETKRTGTQGK